MKRDGILGAIAGAAAASAVFLFGGSAPTHAETQTVCLAFGSVVDGGTLISADVSGRLVSDGGVAWARANGAWPADECDLAVFLKANALLEGR